MKQVIQFATNIDCTDNVFVLGAFKVGIRRITKDSYIIKIIREKIPWKQLYGIISTPQNGEKTSAYSFNIWGATIMFGIKFSEDHCSFGFTVKPGFNNYK